MNTLSYSAILSPLLPSFSQAFILPPQKHKVRMTRDLVTLHTANYSAEWINLLSPDLGITAPNRIDPPRSGAVSFSTDKKLLTFGGYAEVASDADDAPPNRFVVNGLWEFAPYQDASSAWGWTKVDQQKNSYIPGPRLATAMAFLPSSSQSVLLGGWDPQVPGTGGIILDDVSVLDVNTLQWSKPTSVERESKVLTIPGGPTSRHIAVPLQMSNQNNEVEEAILLHNHRSEDHVLLLSLSNNDKSANKKSDQVIGKWTRQPTSGDVPSSRGLHCAAQLNDSNSDTKHVVIFGGAAKDGNMSNEAFVLDINTWKWTKLSTTGDQPSPRAGACLCSLDESTVILFGGAKKSETGLVGLNDVFALTINAKDGTGSWKCLIENTDVDESNVGGSCPPGRNAATLTKVHARSLIPDSLLMSSTSNAHQYFLLQGGWNPFRTTYNDAFILCISSE
ncbi:hypothetical protein ACHAXN_007526 [Cyclotella atomus]